MITLFLLVHFMASTPSPPSSPPSRTALVSKSSNRRNLKSPSFNPGRVRRPLAIHAPLIHPGVKFVCFTSLAYANTDSLLQTIYFIYADTVMKNPFHTPEMPIRTDAFDGRLQQFILTGKDK